MAGVRARLSVAMMGMALTATLVSGCGSTVSAGTSATDASAIMSATCSRCHPITRVNNARHDRAGWTATIGRMRAHGAQLTDQQAQAVVDYLTKRDGGS